MLTPLYGKNSGVNAVSPEKKRRQRRLTGKIVAFTRLDRKKSGVNAVVQEKIAVLTALNWKNSGVNAIVPEKNRP